ncbi:MAG: hypothetical protein KTR25_20965 [Myxococcales bacterium]|nr:hypothetical protein [Myxococcales bacterium]
MRASLDCASLRDHNAYRRDEIPVAVGDQLRTLEANKENEQQTLLERALGALQQKSLGLNQRTGRHRANHGLIKVYPAVQPLAHATSMG